MSKKKNNNNNINIQKYSVFSLVLQLSDEICEKMPPPFYIPYDIIPYTGSSRIVLQCPEIVILKFSLHKLLTGSPYCAGFYTEDGVFYFGKIIRFIDENIVRFRPMLSGDYRCPRFIDKVVVIRERYFFDIDLKECKKA